MLLQLLFSVIRVTCIHWFSERQTILSQCEGCGMGGKLENWESSTPSRMFTLSLHFIHYGWKADAYPDEGMWTFNELRYVTQLRVSGNKWRQQAQHQVEAHQWILALNSSGVDLDSVLVVAL